MKAKARANFINSVAGGQKIPCPQCSSLNDADAKFCINCGKEITMGVQSAQQQSETDKVPFSQAPLDNQAGEKPFREVAATVSSVQENVSSVFAQGLPAWDIVPPQIMVRRKRK